MGVIAHYVNLLRYFSCEKLIHINRTVIFVIFTTHLFYFCCVSPQTMTKPSSHAWVSVTSLRKLLQSSRYA